ncbi:MAG: glycosyltransferase [Bacteroidia bacterium]|nr:glycosyltransferase [Bacteroidia bacterium]
MEKNKRHIAILGPGYPLRGGPALLNENFCLELSGKGHKAEIISFSFQYPSFLFPGTSQYDFSREKPSCPIHSLIHTLNPISWFRTARYLRKSKADIVIIRYWLPYFAPALGTIARLVRKHMRVFAIADNIIPHEKRWGDKILTRYFIGSLHGVICMSGKVEHDLKINFPEKPHIKVYHPLYETYPRPVSMEEARKRLGIPPDKKVILFFGLIRKYKGLHLLLDAARELIHSFPEVLILVAGDFYDDRQNYEPALSMLEKEGHLVLYGRFVPDDEIHYYFCSANVCVQPYLNATNSGVSMVSYFYGLPVIATNVGGLPEIIPHGECGLLCEPNTEDLKKQITYYFEKQLEAPFRKNIETFRKNFSWDTFINKVLQFCDSVT